MKNKELSDAAQDVMVRRRLAANGMQVADLRHIFIAILFLLNISIPFSFHAQQPWNYATLREAHLDDAYLVEPPAELRGRLSKVFGKTENPYNRLYRLSFHEHPKSGRAVLLLQFDSLSFSLREPLATELLPYLVSDRYWCQRFATLQQWAFVALDNGRLLDVDTSDRRYGDFSPVVWLGYSYQPSVEWPVVFSVRTNRARPQTLTLAAMQRLAEWGAFCSVEALESVERNIALQRQEEEKRQRQLQFMMDSLDRVTYYYARLADSITLFVQRDSADQAEQRLMVQVQETKERMNRDRIFVMSINPAHSDYMFGLELNLYNPFPKTVTKLEITVTPVNERGQLQKDQFNRDVRTIRCMGPIRPGSPAQYTFDELFWDDRGRIKYMRVTSVVFHFTDGTTRSFRGYENILKHTLYK